ncbi:Elongator subunit ELP6 ASCRUDRAFT_76925 [Ascoidea rubescens DSM 1968]|uniref:Elongator complex protein 6 n=1 Tax=Ascoidea rubescens DSM 1968 TaxID=1344418 RepID=A0A1D2VD11_9ASCO|nr:hypothetical protein ASCRUDRAFT_76925 [Ascoidea rubescens DSM 1968]ODV59525.1 hypothetical protein ASCRUDRAFT_76925 [Ascoidea rubescens DSM 1968]
MASYFLAEKQQFNIFDDSTVISPKLLQNDSTTSFSTITSCPGSSSSWLVRLLIKNLSDLAKDNDDHISVFFVSFIENKNFWDTAMRKLNVNISFKKSSRSKFHFHFIDCFTDLFTKKLSINDLTDLSVKTFFVNYIIRQILAKYERFSSNSKMVIFIHNPEILLSSTMLQSLTLFNLILTAIKLTKCKLLFHVSNLSPKLADFSNSLNNDNSLEYKITDYISRLHYISNFNLHITPLKTGAASDITGKLSVVNGSRPVVDVISKNDQSLSIVEKQFLYFINKDGNPVFYFM